MAFWDAFRGASGGGRGGAGDAAADALCALHGRLRGMFPGDGEEALAEAACVAGLLASVATRDLVVHDGERAHMRDALVHWMGWPAAKAEAVSGAAIDDARELAGVEDHAYSEALAGLLPEDDRHSLLEALFEMAASDGGVSEQESEHIRLLARGLGLGHRHFVSARASVRSRLDALKRG